MHFLKKNIKAIMGLSLLLGCASIMWSRWPADPIKPCPESLQTMDMPVYYAGKFPTHQLLVAVHEGVERSLDCVGLKSCPKVPKSVTTLTFTVDSCSLTDTRHDLSVYRILQTTDGIPKEIFQSKTLAKTGD